MIISDSLVHQFTGFLVVHKNAEWTQRSMFVSGPAGFHTTRELADAELKEILDGRDFESFSKPEDFYVAEFTFEWEAAP